MKLGRNDECHCGSGKKYKKCCLAIDEAVRADAFEMEGDPLRSAELRAVYAAGVETPAGRLSHVGTLGTGSQLRIWSSAREAEERRFSRAQPCESLGKLLDVLAAEHCAGFLYRGQVQPFPGLIPSGYRSAMPEGADDTSVIRLDPDLYHAGMSELESRRFAAFTALIRDYGISLGNILAQQYGLSSEAIDVTGDLQVAGFFASRPSPDYRQWTGGEGTELGVIYRLPYDTETWGNPTNLDAFLTCMLTEVPDHGPVYFPYYRKRRDLPGELQQQIHEAFAAAGGERRVSLYSPFIVVDEGFVRTALPALDFAATRIGRQHGGFLRPPVHRVCVVARHVRIRPTPLFKMFDPPMAIGDEIQGVGNSVMMPDLDAFYFRHGDYRVPLEPEYLWPTPEEDALYAQIQRIAGEGVVDPGYRRT